MIVVISLSKYLVKLARVGNGLEGAIPFKDLWLRRNGLSWGNP